MLRPKCVQNQLKLHDLYTSNLLMKNQHRNRTSQQAEMKHRNKQKQNIATSKKGTSLQIETESLQSIVMDIATEEEVLTHENTAE